MRRMLLLSGAALTLAALAACSSGGGGAGANLSRLAPGGPVHDAQIPKAAAPVPSPPDDAVGLAGGGTGSVENAGGIQLDTGTKIFTASISVAVKGANNVARRANEANGIVTGVGGEVDSDDRTAGKHAYATLRLLVPPGDLRTVLTRLSELGKETSRSGSARDVTTEVADVNSRVVSAQQAIVRLRTLYAKATKVRDVISIENELNSREADLESLQARQRALGRETSMATITLQLTTAGKPAHHAATKHHSGFVGGLQRGWDAFRSAAGWLATALGAILPFLLLVLVLALAVRLLWPRARRAVPVAPSAPAE